MRRLHTCSRRQRRQRNRALGDTVLRSWHCYVDADLRRGMFLTVQVLKSRRLIIQPVPVDPNAPNPGLELLRALERHANDK